MKHDKKSASIAFDCSFSNVKSFNVIDPINNIALTGYICKQEGIAHRDLILGPMGGALIIITVDNQSIDPQLIYSAPKTYFPVKTGSVDFLDDFSGEEIITKYLFTKKWDGVNIIFYKYYDVNGKCYITGKTRGSPVLTDGENGNFLTWVLSMKNKYSHTKEYQEFLRNDEVQGISFELCGSACPMMVKYDFELDMIPLFKIYFDGKIVPFVTTDAIGPEPFTSNVELRQHVKKLQDEVFEINQKAGSFVIEGYILYLFDRKGYLADKMYKIKPKDMTTWINFDELKKLQVSLAIRKLEGDYTEDDLRRELDLSTNDWETFRGEIMTFAEAIKPPRIQQKSDSPREMPITTH